jgi:hypothetical protein
LKGRWRSLNGLTVPVYGSGAPTSEGSMHLARRGKICAPSAHGKAKLPRTSTRGPQVEMKKLGQECLAKPISNLVTHPLSSEF